MAARIWSKVDTQQFIQRLRSNGYVVTKEGTAYKCLFDGRELFRALPGSRGYLVRYDEKAFPSKEVA